MTPDEVRRALARAKVAVEERRTPLPPIATEAHTIPAGSSWVFQAVWPHHDTRLRRVRAFGVDFDPRDLWVPMCLIGQRNLYYMAMWEGENFIGRRDYSLSAFEELDFAEEDETPARVTVSVSVENRGHEPRVLALEFHADAVDDPIRKVYRAANLLREIERAQASLGEVGEETLALLDVVLEHREPEVCAVCKKTIEISSIAALAGGHFAQKEGA